LDEIMSSNKSADGPTSADLPEVTTDMPAVRMGEATPFGSRVPEPPRQGAKPPAGPTSPLVPPPAPLASPSRPPSLAPAARHALEAVRGGVAGASLAASATERAQRQRDVAAPEPAAPHNHEAASRPPSADHVPRVLVDLLWHTPQAPSRARQHPAWSELDDAGPTSWIVDGSAAPSSERDPKRDVVRALTRIEPLDAVALQRSLRDALDDEGLFVRPALVLAGELEMRFDPTAQLGEMVAAARPFAKSERRLQDAFNTAADAIASGTRLLPSAIDAIGARLAGAFATTVKSLPADYLTTAAERALLEEHRYASLVVLGSRHHCAHLTLAGGTPVPTYLPEAMAGMLPLMRRFSVRVLAEPHLRQDPNEPEPLALAVLAVARATAVP
jgi:hypothetical protein